MELIIFFRRFEKVIGIRLSEAYLKEILSGKPVLIRTIINDLH